MKRFLILIGLACLIFVGPHSAWAHTFTETDIYLELGQNYFVEHEEHQTEWGGWAIFQVTNTGSEAWGDFHFELSSVEPDISSINWTDADSSQSGFSFVIDNNLKTLDIYFYGDPVNPGESATFEGYTSNPNGVSFFGVTVYPTPVPIPGAIWFLGSGILAIIGSRKSFKDK